jgi:hypothetical protein
VASQLLEEVTASEQSDSLVDAREMCADGTYFPNNVRIKMDLQEFGRGGMDWIEVDQNRDRWWALVNPIMDLWVP